MPTVTNVTRIFMSPDNFSTEISASIFKFATTRSQIECSSNCEKIKLELILDQATFTNGNPFNLKLKVNNLSECLPYTWTFFVERLTTWRTHKNIPLSVSSTLAILLSHKIPKLKRTQFNVYFYYYFLLLSFFIHLLDRHICRKNRYIFRHTS